MILINYFFKKHFITKGGGSDIFGKLIRYLKDLDKKTCSKRLQIGIGIFAKLNTTSFQFCQLGRILMDFIDIDSFVISRKLKPHSHNDYFSYRKVTSCI